MKTYSGEFIRAETGETPLYSIDLREVNRLVREMKDGDTLVINCTEE